MAPEQLQQHFVQLDRLLSEHRDYWQLRPYTLTASPWEQQAPALCRWLDQLSSEQIEQLDGDTSALARALRPFLAQAEEIDRLGRLPRLPRREIDPATREAERDARLALHIPGRKWAQIDAFACTLADSGYRFVEWCSGKGHLGRLLAHRYRRSVQGVEWDRALCDAGRLLAEPHRLPVTFHPLDARESEAAALLQPDRHAVALHACGELHLSLLRAGAAQRCPAITLSPCCYYRIPDPYYRPLSQLGKRSPLRLDSHDLRLPLQESVTSGERIRRLRDNEVRWRLGFDALQRDISGRDHYLTVPAVQKSILNRDFEHFCRWAAARREVSLPPQIDFARFEQIGESRRRQVMRIELVRHLFRRPLELWLVLDRALFLSEHGYALRIGEFCEKGLTPRNILIEGRLTL